MIQEEFYINSMMILIPRGLNFSKKYELQILLRPFIKNLNLALFNANMYFDSTLSLILLCFGNEASRDRYVGQLVCHSVGLFRGNFQKSLNDVMQGLYCTVCVHWSGPWYSTCVQTTVGITQSGIEQEYMYEH